MKKTVRALALALALVMLLAVAVSCGETAQEQTTTAPVAATTAPEGSEAETEYRPTDHIRKEDLEQYEVKFLIPTHDWAICNLTAEEITGDTIQDAICERQIQVEQFLNCKLTEYTSPSAPEIVNTLMSTAAASGDDAYDLTLLPTDQALNLYLKGAAADQSTLESINLDNPWWESSFNKQVNLTSKRYITFSNASLIYYSSFYIFCFNKEMIDSYKLKNPYDLVASGEWTWDKAYEMMKVVGRDSDQDGICGPATSEDILGLTGHINHSRNLIFSSGFTICERDAEDNLVFNGLSENYIDAFTKFTEYFITSQYVAISGTSVSRYTGYTAAPGIKNYVSVFVEGRSLFLTTGTNEVMQIRDSEVEYGIVVVPKYSKDQTDYITPVYSATAGFVIPTCCGDTERAGLILETLGAFSYQNLVDKHISIVLHYRVANDATAIGMINQAYASGAIDVAMANNFGTCTGLLNNLNVAGQTGITNIFTMAKSKIQKDIKSYLTQLADS